MRLSTTSGVLLIVCCGVLPDLKMEDPIDIVESWGRWARDAIKAFQDAKVLSGGFLDKTKKLSDNIANNIKKIEKAGDVDDIFREKYRKDFVAFILSLDSSKRKATPDAIKKMIADAENRLAALIAKRKAAALVARDMESMKVVMNDRIGATKDLPPKTKEVLSAKVLAIEKAGAACHSFSQWSDDAESGCMKAIEALKDILDALEGGG